MAVNKVEAFEACMSSGMFLLVVVTVRMFEKVKQQVCYYFLESRP